MEDNSSIDKKMLEESHHAKVVYNGVKIKPKSNSSMILDTFFPEDLETVKKSIVVDYVIPGIKRLVLDSLELIFNGRVVGKNKSNSSVYYYGGYTSYNNPNIGIQPKKTRPQRYNPNDITIFDRGEAEMVLWHMKDYLQRYGRTTVADMYELVGIDNAFTDYKYGWNNLDTAYITKSRGSDGYNIILPPPIALE